jgi:hypothetical protein
MLEDKDFKGLKLADFPKTLEETKIGNMIKANIMAFAEVIASNFSLIAYLFMILSMFVTAGIVSLVYPFAVFGYALMEESRPGKRFWDFIIRYTLLLLFWKFIFQLDCWQSIDINLQ